MTKDMLSRRSFITVATGASAFALAACGGKPADDGAATDDAAAAPTGDGTDAKSEGVMTYDEYMAAAVDDPVTVECFIQANQSWWEGTVTIYAIDKGKSFRRPCNIQRPNRERRMQGTR